MQINPPFGYSEIVPLRNDQKVRLPAPGALPEFCRRVNAVQADRLICVEKTFLSDDGERMFDDKGTAFPRWQPIEKLLQEYEADLERGREMCAILAGYALLEPFTLQASLREGGAMNLGGMHRVDERKLEFLNAAQHKNLIRKGVMGRIYAHLISLENFARLLARKNLAAGGAKTA
jgi:hypothetical protein